MLQTTYKQIGSRLNNMLTQSTIGDSGVGDSGVGDSSGIPLRSGLLNLGLELV